MCFSRHIYYWRRQQTSRDEEAFWQAVEASYGTPLAESARRLLRLQRFFSRPYLDQWLAPSVANLPPEMVVQEAAEMLRNLDTAGYIAPSDDRALTPRTSSGKHDERWRLWSDLRDRRAEIVGLHYDEPPWTPLHVALDRERGAVVLSFDNRLSRPVVMGEIKRLWPNLIGWGWLRETHPPSERGMALVRYVCLESRLGAEWRERMEGWNSSRYVEEHPEWRYDSASGLEKAFHRYEASLAGPQVELIIAGERHKTQRSLALFYDPQVRQNMLELREMNDQAQRASTGDRVAREAEVELLRRALGDDQAAALRLSFQFNAEIDALVARAQAGDAAAGEEAYNRVYTQRGFWPAQELRERLPQSRDDQGTSTHQRNDPEEQQQSVAQHARAFKEAVADALRARVASDRDADPESPARLRCTACGTWVALSRQRARTLPELCERRRWRESGGLMSGFKKRIGNDRSLSCPVRLGESDKKVAWSSAGSTVAEKPRHRLGAP